MSSVADSLAITRTMVDRTPLDDVEFLARSRHRVAVLDELRSGPMTRRDLHDETGISQPTLGRVLGALVDRNWIERGGQEYGLTPFGELVADEFAALLDTVETVQTLGDLAAHLPTERMDFDLGLLGDARVTRPTPSDVLAHVHRAEALLADAEHLRLVSPSVFPAALEGLVDRLGGDVHQHHEAVVAAGALDAVRSNPALVAATRSLIETDGVEVLQYDGPMAVSLAIVDGTAVIGPLDDNGIPQATIETENETVRAWVEGQIDEFRAASTPVTPDDFP